MKTQASPKRHRGILLILLTVALSIAAIIAVESEPARQLGLDIFCQGIAGAITLGTLVYFLKKMWNVWKTWQRVLFLLLIVLGIFATASDIVDDWSRLPWVKAEAFITVDEFMTALKEQNYSSAVTRFTPRMQRCVAPSDLSQPNARPVSWELYEMDEFSNIVGTATFSDGQELSLTVRMVWSDGQWEINGFWFGGLSESGLDYSSMHCGE
jgi:hypothetical protein